MLSVALFLPVEKIDENADLRSLEKMDSLSFEMVVAQIEQTLHREIDPLELLKLTSVRDLAALPERESLIGLTYEDLIRMEIACGEITPDSAQGAEAYIAYRRAQLRSGEYAPRDVELADGRVVPLNAAMRAQIGALLDTKGREGLRLLGVARRPMAADCAATDSRMATTSHNTATAMPGTSRSNFPVASRPARMSPQPRRESASWAAGFTPARRNSGGGTRRRAR